VEFEWDPKKAAKNFHQHRISFNEAATVFGDSLGTTVSDPDHSLAEDRYITVGCPVAAVSSWSPIRNVENGFVSLAHGN
jgi:uncharacterized DUF497 family protein